MAQAHPPAADGKRFRLHHHHHQPHPHPHQPATPEPPPAPDPRPAPSPAQPPPPAGSGRVVADFGLSRHAEERARQRGYRESDLALIVDHGTPVHDGYVMTPRDVAAFELWAKRTAVRMRRLSGSFVAVAESTITSVYRPAKPKRRRLLEEAV
jgi:hypothetical protein